MAYPTTVHGNPHDIYIYIWGVGPWEALFVVSQKWVPFPTALVAMTCFCGVREDQGCQGHVQWWVLEVYVGPVIECIYFIVGFTFEPLAKRKMYPKSTPVSMTF